MLKVLTLNLWHDSGPWPQRAQRIREWIERLDPDVIGFQEVLTGPGVDLVRDVLGDEILPHRDFVAACPFWMPDRRHLSFGNAVASRWPITSRSELRLPDLGDGETRAALTVTLETPLPGGELAVTCTHLHWKLDHGMVRERQVAALAGEVLRRSPKDGFPPLLLGDFNAEPDSDEIRFLCGFHSLEGKSVLFYDAWRVAGEGGDGVTWSNRNPHARTAHEPDRRIDYIFAGYPMLDGAGRVDRCFVVCNDEKDGVWPSDHFGLYAELRTEPT